MAGTPKFSNTWMLRTWRRRRRFSERTPCFHQVPSHLFGTNLLVRRRSYQGKAYQAVYATTDGFSHKMVSFPRTVRDDEKAEELVLFEALISSLEPGIDDPTEKLGTFQW